MSDVKKSRNRRDAAVPRAGSLDKEMNKVLPSTPLVDDEGLSFVVKGDSSLLKLVDTHLQPLIHVVDEDLHLIQCHLLTEQEEEDDEDEHMEFDPLDVSSLALVLHVSAPSHTLASRHLAVPPWKRHYGEPSVENNFCEDTMDEYYFLHQCLPLCLVQKASDGQEVVQVMRYVSHHNWLDMVQLYRLLLGKAQCDHYGADYCVFTIHKSGGYDIQLGLKQLPKGMVPSGPQSTTLRISTGDLGSLVPLLPNPCHQFSRHIWTTMDLDGNSLQLFVKDNNESDWHAFLETLGPTLELLSMEIQSEATHSIEDIDLSEQYLAADGQRKHMKHRRKQQKKKYKRATPQHQWDSGFIDNGEADDLCEDGACLCNGSGHVCYADDGVGRHSRQSRHSADDASQTSQCLCNLCCGTSASNTPDVTSHKPKKHGGHGHKHSSLGQMSSEIAYCGGTHGYITTLHPKQRRSRETSYTQNGHYNGMLDHWSACATDGCLTSETENDVSSDTLPGEGITFDERRLSSDGYARQKSPHKPSKHSSDRAMSALQFYGGLNQCRIQSSTPTEYSLEHALGGVSRGQGSGRGHGSRSRANIENIRAVVRSPDLIRHCHSKHSSETKAVKSQTDAAINVHSSKALNQCSFDVGPTSQTLAQHRNHIGTTSRNCLTDSEGVKSLPDATIDSGVRQYYKGDNGHYVGDHSHADNAKKPFAIKQDNTGHIKDAVSRMPPSIYNKPSTNAHCDNGNTSISPSPCVHYDKSHESVPSNNDSSTHSACVVGLQSGACNGNYSNSEGNVRRIISEPSSKPLNTSAHHISHNTSTQCPQINNSVEMTFEHGMNDYPSVDFEKPLPPPPEYGNNPDQSNLINGESCPITAGVTDTGDDTDDSLTANVGQWCIYKQAANTGFFI